MAQKFLMDLNGPFKNPFHVRISLRRLGTTHPSASDSAPQFMTTLIHRDKIQRQEAQKRPPSKPAAAMRPSPMSTFNRRAKSAGQGLA
jgi:hypothetical protein